MEALGPNAIDYPGLVTARLPAERVEATLALLRHEGLEPYVDHARTIATATANFDPAAPATRRGAWKDREEQALPIPGLAWVQFAFPIKREWSRALELCVFEVLDHTSHRSVLVSAPSLEAVRDCPGASAFLAAVEPLMSLDRAEPEVVDTTSGVLAALAPGVTVAVVAADISLEIEVEDRSKPGDGLALLWARGEGVGRQLLDDPRVIRLAVADDESGTLSDERQALILARRFVDPASPSGEPTAPTETTPGTYTGTYTQWLQARDLYNVGGHQATIAFFDTGIDDGDPADGSAFHPDLAGRVLDAYNITKAPPIEGFLLPELPEDPEPVHGPGYGSDDRPGHGTHVMSVAIGAGIEGGRPGTGNPVDWFAQGQGIAPEAFGLAVKRYRYLTCSADLTGFNTATDQMALGHDWARGNGATIASHSWNSSTTGGYNPGSNDFERIALDAVAHDDGAQPLAIVFSAGNYGAGAKPGVVRSPANAKNVISVGAVDSYYPGALSCFGYDPPTGPNNVSAFSARGLFLDGDLHQVRVRPTVVAPGWRVDGARRTAHPCPANTCGQTTILGPPKYSWTFGTSFSAPAVSGGLALKEKQLVDGTANVWSYGQVLSVTPHPTLLHAGLVATAESLGPRDPVTGLIGPCTEGDCRPSYKYGWGLMSLDRLLDQDTPAWILNAGFAFTGVGQVWGSPWLEVGDPTKEVLIALVWHDLPTPSGFPTDSLKRDLALKLASIDGNPTLSFHGNNLEENPVSGPIVDSGYSRAILGGAGVQTDARNNVEVIFLRQGTLEPQTRFALTVTSMTHNSNDDFPSQRFSVYAWNVTCWDNDILYNCATLPQ